MTEFDLRLGDCVAGMKSLPIESIDLIVTSPPYNLGIRYRKFEDNGDRASYLRWCREWAAQLRRLLKPNGSFFLNIGATPSNPMLPHELMLSFRDIFVLQNTIHWIKSITIEQRPHLNPLAAGEEDAKRHVRGNAQSVTYGHFKPINSPRYLNDCHEYIFHFTCGGDTPLDRLSLGVRYQDKSNIARWRHTRGSDLRCRGNTWFVPYQTIKSRDKQRPHPATFPVELAVNCIKLHGVARVQTMLDPFLGIGNSAVAAERCAVPKFIGFEIDETYLAEAQRRIASVNSLG